MGTPSPEAQTAVRGLENIIAGETRISTVDGVNGVLVYNGFDVHELAEKTTFDEALRIERSVASGDGEPGAGDPRRWARLHSAARLARMILEAKASNEAAKVKAMERSLKRTQIKMMPMYHWLGRRIEAHVKICVLALFIERVAELKCDKPWSRLRPILANIQATEFVTPSHSFYQLNELPKGAKTLLKKLAINRSHKVFSIQHRNMSMKMRHPRS